MKHLLMSSVFLFCASAQAASLTTIATFPSGIYALGGMTFANGSAFGVGGSGVLGTAYGTVYSAKPGGSTFTTVFTSTGGAKGAYPYGQLTADSAGNLYGAFVTGGLVGAGNNCNRGGATGCGVIFKLTPNAKKTVYTETALYKFKGGADGFGPVGGFVIDSAGDIFGVTQYGGNAAALPYGSGPGTVWELVNASGVYTKTTLYKFQGGADGAYPAQNIVADSSGNLYGTTIIGGVAETGCNQQSYDYSAIPSTPDGLCGTVWKLTKSGTTYTKSTLHSFTDVTDGSFPVGGLAIDPSANLYGTTYMGGNNTLLCQQGNGASGCGVVYTINHTSGNKTNLHVFTGITSDAGEQPGPLVYDPNNGGAVYGANEYNTTDDFNCGSTFYCGNVFRVTVTGGFSVLVSLDSTSAQTIGGLGVDPSGNLYGATQYGTNTAYEVTGTGW